MSFHNSRLIAKIDPTNSVLQAKYFWLWLNDNGRSSHLSISGEIANIQCSACVAFELLSELSNLEN